MLPEPLARLIFLPGCSGDDGCSFKVTPQDMKWPNPVVLQTSAHWAWTLGMSAHRGSMLTLLGRGRQVGYGGLQLLHKVLLDRSHPNTRGTEIASPYCLVQTFLGEKLQTVMWES